MFKHFFIAFFMTCAFVHSQKQPDQQIDLKSKIQQIHLNQRTGISISITSNAIFGISGQEGEILWEHPINNLFFDENLKNVGSLLNSGSVSEMAGKALNKNELPINDIDGSHLVEVSRGSSYAIIDVIEGKILFSSQKDKAHVYNQVYIPRLHAMLIPIDVKSDKEVNSVSELRLALFDLKTGTYVWNILQDKNKSTLNVFSSSISSGQQVSPRLDSEDNIYFYLLKSLMKIDKESGEILWKRDYNKNGFNDFYINNSNQYLIQLSRAGGLGGFMGTKANLMVVDANTGKDIWEEKFKIKSPIYFEDLNEDFLLAHNSGFNVYNFKTGDKKWKKGPRGQTKRVIKTDGGYIFIEDTYMHFIGEDGVKKWRRGAEISDNREDQIFALDEYKDKIVFVTSTYANIIDRNSGKKIWSKHLKLNEKRPVIPFFDEASQNYYIYNDEELFKFNINNEERPKAFTKVKIKREKEINNFELRSNDNFIISGEREIAVLGINGDIKLQKYYKEAGNRRLYKSLLIGGSVVAGLAGSSVTMTDAQGNVVGQAGLFTTYDNSQNLVASSEGLDVASSQFNRNDSSKNSKDILFYFTDEGGESNRVLVAVSKDQGKEIEKFKFNNSNPVYEVDTIDNKVYYGDGSTLKIFSY